MSDSDHSGGGSPPSSQTPGGGDTPTGSWLARLREAFGFRTTATLRENLEEALGEENAIDAAFSPEERAMIRNILRLRETRADDVMVPRADIAAVDVTIPLADLLVAFEASGHSRMPAYRDTLDDALGMVHIKDLMAFITAGARRGAGAASAPAGLDVGSVDLSVSLEASGLVRPVLFVPPSMPATDLLARMQASHIQMALVIDEYGGTDGLVSIEDVVETIVGEIDDEHDEDDGPLVQNAAPGVFVADARADLEEVTAALGERFRVGDYDEEVDTLGGLLFAVLGRIPARGEIVSSPDLPGYEIEVLDADPRRIRKVRIVETADPAPAGEAETA